MWNISICSDYPLTYEREVIGIGETLEDAIKDAEDCLERALNPSDVPHAILTDENQISKILDYDDIIEAIQNAAYNGAYPIIKEIAGEQFWDRYYWGTKQNEQ